MVDERGIDGIRDIANKYQNELKKSKEKLKELNEEEKRLKKELETVRSNLEYYTALVSDMKKRMNQGENWSMFNDI